MERYSVTLPNGRVVVRRAVDDLIAAGARPVGPGRLYEVNINAEPEDFLDWDAPLAQQPESVRSALGDVQARLDDNIRKYNFANAPQVAGKDLYGLNMLTGLDYFDAPSQTQGLLNRGIPGLKYLDQGSRSIGDGTRNYVVFDDSLIDILNKY